MKIEFLFTDSSEFIVECDDNQFENCFEQMNDGDRFFQECDKNGDHVAINKSHIVSVKFIKEKK
jgi:hypothetical protein